MNLTQQNTPKLEDLGLDSGSMSLAFPGLVDYGNDAPMTMICSAKDAEGPMSATISEGSMSVAGNLSCDVNVWGNNDWVKAVVLKFAVDTMMTMGVGNDSANFNLTSVGISKMKHRNSTIGGMSDENIKDVFDMMIGFMVPVAKSMKLPELPYVELDNAVAYLKPGYVELFTDIDVNKILVEKVFQQP